MIRLGLISQFIDDAVRMAKQHGLSFREGSIAFAAGAEVMSAVERDPGATEGKIDVIRQEIVCQVAADHDSLPVIVCLIGSRRFRQEFGVAAEVESVAGRIVLAPVFSVVAPGTQPFGHIPGLELVRRKIELADEVLVVDPDGYIGESTRRSIEHAEKLGKLVRYWSKGEIGSSVFAKTGGAR